MAITSEQIDTAGGIFGMVGNFYEAYQARKAAKAIEEAQAKATRLATLSANRQKQSIDEQRRQRQDASSMEQMATQRSAAEQRSEIRAGAGDGGGQFESRLSSVLGIRSGESLAIGNQNLINANAQSDRELAAADINLSTRIANINSQDSGRPSVLGTILGAGAGFIDGKTQIRKLTNPLSKDTVDNYGKTGRTDGNAYSSNAKGLSGFEIGKGLFNSLLSGIK